MHLPVNIVHSSTNCVLFVISCHQCFSLTHLSLTHAFKGSMASDLTHTSESNMASNIVEGGIVGHQEGRVQTSAERLSLGSWESEKNEKDKNNCKEDWCQ